MSHFRRGDRVQQYLGPHPGRTGIAVDTAGTIRQLVFWDGAASPYLESRSLLTRPHEPCLTCHGLAQHKPGCAVVAAADDGRHRYVEPIIRFDGENPRCRICDRAENDRLHP